MALAKAQEPASSAAQPADLGYNPMQTLLEPVLGHLPHASAAYLTGAPLLPPRDLRAVHGRPEPEEVAPPAQQARLGRR